MSALLGVQQAFQDYLLSEEMTVLPYIVSSDAMPAIARLGVYAYAYRARLVEALANQYPMLNVLLGDDEFETLGQAYAARYPSTFRSLRRFGDQMAGFIQAYYPDYPFLVELVQIEWVMALVFDAADAPVASVDVMSTVASEAWERVILQFHPAVQLLTFAWDIMPFWQVLMADEVPDEPMPVDPVTWVFWRHGLEIKYGALSADEAWAMQVMRRGGNFGQMCEGLCQWFDVEAAAVRAASLLKAWLESGLVSFVYQEGV